MIQVSLSPQEMYLASIVGVRRRLTSRTERNGADRATTAESWYYNVVGAQGEMAAAKALGLYWAATINAEKGEADIGPDWQVRTLAGHDYDLIVRKDDRSDQKFVLVTGEGPDFRVHGWMLGEDAKRDEWFKDRGGRGKPCWWVPQADLNPIQ